MAEFIEALPIKPSPAQTDRLFSWMETCRKVWNLGLDALLELEANTSWVKGTNPETGKSQWQAVPSSRLAIGGEGTPFPVQTKMYRNVWKDEAGKVTEEAWGECCWIIPKGRTGGTVHRITGESTHRIEPDLIRVGQSCPLPIPAWRMPKLGLQIPGKFTLQYLFTQKQVKEIYPYFADEFSQVPSWFIRGVCDSLWQAWSRYKSGTAGEPRFKRAGESIRSLSYADPSTLVIQIDSERRHGTIAIPKLDRTAQGKSVAGPLHVTDLGRRMLVEVEGETCLQPISVVRLVYTPGGNWQVHLTSYRIEKGEIWNLLRLVLVTQCQFLSPLAQQMLLCTSPWSLIRHQDLTLTVPGEGYVVAVDNRGQGYSVLPRRHTDGALDPHNLIAKLDRQIEALQKQISWKYECAKRHGTPVKSNRLQQLKDQKRKLEDRRTRILRASRQKIAYFLSERSRKITVISKPAERIRKPKAKLKPGTINPPQFEPNGAEVVAELNKTTARSAPGEFIDLIKRNAKQRAQVLTVQQVKKPAKKKK